MATTITAIEGAFKSRLSSISIADIGGVSRPVTVFVDMPDAESYVDVVSPVINISFVGRQEAEDLREGDYEWKTTATIPDGLNADIRTKNRIDKWWNVDIQVRAMCVDDPVIDRNLVEAIDRLLEDQGYITVGSDDYWLFRVNFATQKMTENDTTQYLNIWDFQVLANFVASDSTKTTRPANEFHLRGGMIRSGVVDKTTRTGLVSKSSLFDVNNPPQIAQAKPSPISSSGTPVSSASDAEQYEMPELRYNDSDVWYP